MDKKLPIIKVSQEETEKVIRHFRMMEIASQQLAEFDPRDHFDEADDDYHFMMRFMGDDSFDYRAFFDHVIRELPLGYRRVLTEYPTIVERYCDPDSPVLEPCRPMVDLEPGDIVVKGTEFLAEFDTVSEWFQHLSTLDPATFCRLLHVDRNGYCVPHEDMLARVNRENPFPVKTYVVYRVSTEPKPHSSIRNN